MFRRQFIHTALALFLPLSLAAPPLHAEPAVQQAAPAFSGQSAEGRTITLQSLRGKTVVLEWTNHDGPFVKKHYESGNIPQLQKEAARQGVVWLQVVSSAPGKQGYVDGPTALRLNGERGAAPSATLLHPEGTIGKIYGAQTSPHLFIINPQGVLVYKGGIDSIPSADRADLARAENYVRDALAALAAGRKISNPSTRPYGCSIKYAS